MMVCRNCGAEIDDKATSCPYCNAMQYDASEAEYMNNLYKMNSQMDNLDDEANKYVFSSVLKSAAIIIICIAAAVLIGIFWGFMRYFKFAWRSNIINVLLPFRYPTKYDTLMLGGISTNICT